MGTPAGLAAFRNETINAIFKKILTAWCRFLSSGDSLYVLNDSPRGWMCDNAREALKIEEFCYDPHDAHWGFASWNDRNSAPQTAALINGSGYAGFWWL